MKTRVKNISDYVLSFTFCLALIACNKEEFFEKNYLDNPFQETTSQGGVDSGTGENTQGGVDSGVDGGTANGSTTNSSTSGVEDGSTSAGVDGGSVTSGVDDGSVTSGVDDGTTTSGVDDGTTTSGVDDGTTTSGSTTSGSTGGDCNNGHGNEDDGVDESNPKIGLEPKCKKEKEVFKQKSSQSKKLDILWVVDDSKSMDDEQAALGSNFSAFIDDFINKDIDFKMAITTTDTRDGYKGKMVLGSDTKLTSAAARANENKFKDDFRSLVNVGVNGTGNERGLEATEGFMDKHAASFLRPDAYLAVIILSDEEDQSHQKPEYYVNYLKSFKAEAGLVKIYSIVDTELTNIQIHGGITPGYKKYAEASKRTAGIVANIRDDFYSSLSDLGDSVINLLDSFALANEPIDGSLSVFVNGTKVSNYTYEASSRSIKFNAGSIPQVGSEIIVQYLKKK